MKVLKKIVFAICLCVVILAVEKPVTAFAKYIGSHIQRLQGNWGSSGVMNGPIPPFRTTDNPKYICQWQIYTQEKFINPEGKVFQRVNWTWFEIDANKTFFKSSNLDWTVAHVFSKPLDQSEPLSEDEKIDLKTKENSTIPEILDQSVYVSFTPISSEEEGTQYKVNTYISLQQDFGDLIVGGNNKESASRKNKHFENHASIVVKKTTNTDSSSQLQPLNSQLHCEKLN